MSYWRSTSQGEQDINKPATKRVAKIVQAHVIKPLFEAAMLVEFMDLISQEGISNNKLRRALAYVERVLSEGD